MNTLTFEDFKANEYSQEIFDSQFKILATNEFFKFIGRPELDYEWSEKNSSQDSFKGVSLFYVDEDKYKEWCDIISPILEKQLHIGGAALKLAIRCYDSYQLFLSYSYDAVPDIKAFATRLDLLCDTSKLDEIALEQYNKIKQSII